MKKSKRFDYAGLAEVLGQRGVVDPQRLHYALEAGERGPSPFPEVLVGDDLVGDWELSRITCELYGLPFLPTDVQKPDLDLLKALDNSFLRRHRLVPVGRFGDVITVAMPAVVPADVLQQLGMMASAQVLPIVGTVESNNRWIEKHLGSAADDEPDAQLDLADGAQEPAPAMPQASADNWSNIFDEGNANVLLGLNEEDLGSLDLEPGS